MGATPLVLALVGLAFPISLLLFALLFDAAVLVWAAYRTWHDWVAPSAIRIVTRSMAQVRNYHFAHR